MIAVACQTSNTYFSTTRHAHAQLCDRMQLKKAKECQECSKVITWRKKWEKDWDSVRYCSGKCKKRAKSRRLDDVSRSRQAGRVLAATATTTDDETAEAADGADGGADDADGVDGADDADGAAAVALDTVIEPLGLKGAREGEGAATVTPEEEEVPAESDGGGGGGGGGGGSGGDAETFDFSSLSKKEKRDARKKKRAAKKAAGSISGEGDALRTK